jgi:hypothetical protein
MRPLSLLAVLAITLAAAADPVAEVEPNGFSTPDPQALGVLGAAGLEVSGALDPTSENGADPGDRDGFSFTMEAAGPLTAVVDDAGAGRTFVLALAREDEGGVVQIASVQGPAPLTLSCPGLEAGPGYRIGVAAFSDGTALPYGLTLSATSSLPAWTGQPCPGFVPEVEPNGDGSRALHLGDFVTVLCAEGVQSLVSPPNSGDPADPDFFMFRNVLPTPVRFVFEADPGTLRVTIHRLGFVGPFSWIEKQFGGYTEILSPALQPGMTYLVEVRAEQGTAPIAYRMHLEPSAPPPPPPPEPADLTRARLRLGPGPAFRLNGTFEPGLGGDLEAGAPVGFVVRGLEGEIAAGVLTQTRRGRLRYRAPRGTMGLRALDFDPFRGRFSLRGAGLDLQGEVEPGDPLVSVLLDFGDLSVLAEEQGEFSPDGLVLRVRRR